MKQQSNLRGIIAATFGLSLYVTIGLNDTFWTPFLPIELAKLGYSESTIGIIASAYDIAGILSSIATFFVEETKMRRLLFCAGSFIVGLGCLAFGQIIHAPSGLTFVALSIVTRSFMGCGSTLVWCFGVSLLISMFPNWTGRICSCVGASASIGIIFGAPLGSVLFGLGGYTLAFWVVGAIQIALPVACYCAFYLLVEEEEKRIEIKPIKNEKSKSSAIQFVSNKGVLSVSAAAILAASSLGFFAVTISPHLKRHFNIGVEKAGNFFLSFTILRACSAPILGYFIDKGYEGIVFTLLGCVLNIIGFTALALSKYICLDNLIGLELLVGLIGISSTSTFLPLIVLFKKIHEKDGSSGSELVDNYAATMCHLCFAMGLVIGEAFVGGVVYESHGFFNSCFVETALCSFTSILGCGYLYKNNLICKSNLDQRKRSSTITDEHEPLIA